jgi:thiol-disulfide isomerase/thioredoxin
MKIGLVGIIIFWVCSCTTVKVVHIKLKNAKENDGLLGSTQEYVLETIKNRSFDSIIAEKNDLDTFAVFIYPHSPEEYYYQKFIKGDFDSSRFDKVISIYDMDTSKLNYQKYDAESLILMGRKRNGDCIILADANNNDQFSDDSVYGFKNWFNSNERVINNLPGITFYNLISNYDNKQVVFSENIRIKPLRRDSTLKANGRFLLEMRPALISSGYLTGKFKINGVKYKIAVRNLSPKYIFDNNNTIIAISKKDQPYDFAVKRDVSSLYRIGETINLKKKAVELSKIEIDGSAISLNVIPKMTSLEKMDNILVQDFFTRDSFYLNSVFGKNNYLLIDFWGSWCGPCIASFPELKELHSQLDDKGIAFLGVIYDNVKNSDLIKSLLKNNNINWQQVFISQDETNTFVDKYRVTAYPTYFIVDESGKIIYRDFGLPGFQRVKEYIQKNISDF